MRPRAFIAAFGAALARPFGARVRQEHRVRSVGVSVNLADPQGRARIAAFEQVHLPVVMALTVAYMLGSAMPAAAQAALVEDVNSKTAGVEFMDYVQAGKVIRLQPQDTIVLSYMKSCWQEAISGGTVTVGAEQSEVQFGRVERHKVDCDGGKLMLTAQVASQAAGMVFRDMRSGQQASAPKPQITLYGLSPVIEIKGGGQLVIERVDQPGERHELAIASQQLVNGAFYDLARGGTALVAGGIYRAKVNGRQLVFKVDSDAKPGAAPVVGRLLRLQPAS